MDYNPVDGNDEVCLVQPDGYHWIRLQDTFTTEIYDVPVEGDNVISFWLASSGRCDCVRYRAFYHARLNDDSAAEDIPCGNERFKLLGIWDQDGTQIHEGDPKPGGLAEAIERFKLLDQKARCKLFGGSACSRNGGPYVCDSCIPEIMAKRQTLK